MGHTFSNHLYHIIFRIKSGHPLISSDIEDELYNYIFGIAQKQHGKIMKINGMQDHIHILLRLKPSVAVADIVRLIKANSSKWIAETFPHLSTFAWQAGYASFTVSESMSQTIMNYIENQKQHHKDRSYAEEFMEFLNKHGVEYDPDHFLD